ncbi:hypothetical protein AKJ09_06956 [Labilithrix luteola]|uniref:Uncharacterized protein n=1 Tax=Labilithrix luteola TaxID=1391654 RepID=A0A0K1Q3I6_9BACT|nr:hypothetical protein AKJ09_06956 [Labilithrix luteola]
MVAASFEGIALENHNPEFRKHAPERFLDFLHTRRADVEDLSVHGIVTLRESRADAVAETT